MKTTPHQAATLRRDAEALLKTQRKPVKPSSAEDVLKLVHELQVHQIELELQNEALDTAYAEAAALRDKYLDLYDFAPIGYFTVTPAGDITELNLSAATLLGKSRGMLIGRRMQDFVQPESAAAFTEFLATASETTGEASTTLAMRRDNNETIYVKAQRQPFESETVNGLEIRLVMMDLTELKSAHDELLRSFEKFFRYWRP